MTNDVQTGPRCIDVQRPWRHRSSFSGSAWSPHAIEHLRRRDGPFLDDALTVDCSSQFSVERPEHDTLPQIHSLDQHLGFCVIRPVFEFDVLLLNECCFTFSCADFWTGSMPKLLGELTATRQLCVSQQPRETGLRQWISINTQSHANSDTQLVSGAPP